jgi:plastocyanin
MTLSKAAVIALATFCIPILGAVGAPSNGVISGKVTLSGAAPKYKPLNMSKEPECVKLHASDPMFPENVVTGPGNTLRNVVVYISAGANDNTPVPATPVFYEQKGCHYTTHVLAFRVGQEVRISNNDPFSHNIHPLARINREWNKLQPPDTPPFSYSYEHEEFIPIKCNIHPWMQGYFVVLRTSHFAVTGEDGEFVLPELPPGHYTVTAWQETYGTISKDVTITGGETEPLDFTFVAKH